MSLLFVFINEFFIIFLRWSLSKTLYMKWRVTCLLVLRSSCRNFKVLVLIKVSIRRPMVIYILTFRSLMLLIILLMLTFLLHLLHWVIKPEISTMMDVPAASWYHSMHYIIPWHIIVVGRAHLVMSMLVLRIDFTIEVVLVLSMTLPLDVVWLSPRVVRLRVFKLAILWMVHHGG